MNAIATTFFSSRCINFLGALCLVAFFGGLPGADTAHADVYASQLEATNPDTTAFDGDFSDGTGAMLWFTLNDTASTVTVVVIEASSGNTVFETELEALSRGRYSVVWDGTGSEGGEEYTFEVTAEQDNYSSTEWTVFYDSGDQNIFSRGVDVSRDMSSTQFGLFYAPNTGGPLGKGIRVFNPDGSFHDPGLIAPDITDGGTTDWGAGSDDIFSGVLDDQGRFYVSAIPFDMVRRINRDGSVTPVVSGLAAPKGLYIDGSGEDLVLYICDSTRVLRAAIGTDDVFSGDLEVVGEFTDGLPRNMTMDDDGDIYVAFRETDELSSEPLGLKKFDISGALPVSDGDSEWSLGPEEVFRVTSLEMDHGDDGTTADDDILYYSTRVGNDDTRDGIWRVDDIDAAFATSVTQLVSDTTLYFYMDEPANANINDEAALTIDAAGNFILLENSYEHYFFISPPNDGATNSFTTTSPTAMAVNTGLDVDGAEIPVTFKLHQNYPNPFSSATTISYELESAAHTTVKVYNVLGQAVRVLVDKRQGVGPHQVLWDGKVRSGTPAGSGVYVLRVSSGAHDHNILMTLVR